jgi:gliding motility-associated-like protein
VDSVSSNVRLYGFSGSLAYTPTLGCVPLEVNFTPVGLFNIPTITWDFTDGNVTATSLLDPIKHTYTKSGVYLPKLILQDMNGCKTVSTGLDTIKVDESFADFKNGPACEYQDMDFFDNSTGLFSNITSWIWAFDTSSTLSFIKNPKHLYGPPGQYNVRLIVTSANQCKDTIDKLVTINPLPDIDAGADTIICLTDSATLMPAGGVSYIWSPKLYLSCDTCANPMAGVPKRFTYTVIGTDANGCKNKDTVTVDIKTKVKAFVGPGGEICEKDTFGLYAWGAHHYEWKPAESLSDATVPNPIASPHENTKYIVVAYEGRCIPDTHAVNIIVHPLPDVKAEGTATVVAGNTADLRASGSLIRRFEWSPAEDLSCTDCAFPTARPSQTTTYKVIVYSEHQCVDSDRVTITVLCDKSQLFIPNTFTPNGDGQNDVFYPRGAGMDKVQSFRIYNRWGEVVYQKTSFDLNDQNTGWDGSFKGNQLPPDVFVWVLDAICDDGKILTLKGDVTIIR